MIKESLWSLTPEEMGGGMISPTITGDHQNRITDYTAILVEVNETVQLCEERSACGK